MKQKRLIFTQTSVDVKVHLEVVKVLSRIRKQMSQKLVYNNILEKINKTN